jgi:hypothetical protein
VVRGAADLAGWLGAFTLVGAYAGTTTGVLPATSLRYQVLNALGSVGLAAVAALHGAWPSLALNVLWLLIASASVAGRTRLRRRLGPPSRTASKEHCMRTPDRSLHGHGSVLRPRLDRLGHPDQRDRDATAGIGESLDRHEAVRRVERLPGHRPHELEACESLVARRLLAQGQDQPSDAAPSESRIGVHGAHACRVDGGVEELRPARCSSTSWVEGRMRLGDGVPWCRSPRRNRQRLISGSST